MAPFSDSVRDQYNRPVLGATVHVFTQAGGLANLYTESGGPLDNPVSVDALGNYDFYADDAIYRREIRLGSLLLEASDILVGKPPEFTGATGPADNTYTTLAALLASNPSLKSARLVPDPEESEPAGNFNYIDGQWQRQADDGIVGRRDLTGTRIQPVATRLGFAEVDAREFGVLADGTTDDTAALQAAYNAVKARGGGVLRLPPRLMVVNGTISDTVTNGSGVSIRGEGRRQSIIQRTTDSTQPVFRFSGPGGDPTEIYTDYADFAIHAPTITNPVADAFVFERCAKFTVRNIDTRGMQVGLRAAGSLVFQVSFCNFQHGKAAYLGQTSTSTRPDGTSVTLYPNAIELIGCVMNYNRDYAVDQTGSGLSIIGGDISFNGTAGQATSGGIIFRAGSVAEIGSGIAKVDVRWMESNLGTGISVEGGMGAMFTLVVDGLQMVGQEGGRCLSIGSGMFACRDSRFPTTGDKLTIAAISSRLENVYAGTIIDTTPETNRAYLFVNTADDAINGNGGEAAGVTVSLGKALRFRGRNGTLAHQIGPEAGTSRLRVMTGGLGFDAGDRQWAGNLPQYADSAAASAAIGPGWLFRRPDNTIGVS